MRQILVCSTFREFDGSSNTKIHEKFLDGLRCQTYKDFRLIVTNYKEKHVEEAISKCGIPYEFIQSSRTDCRYSITEVVQSSFGYLKRGKHIILWTNTDNIFEPTFFQEIIDNFTEGTAGTSYPHITYSSTEDFEEGNPTDIKTNRPLRTFYQMNPNYWVPDTLWIDGDLFLDKLNRCQFAKYDFSDRSDGMAQTLGIAFYANRLVNLIYRSKISVIQNARSEETLVKELSTDNYMNEETAKTLFTQYHSDRTRLSTDTLLELCSARNIPTKFWPKQHEKVKLYQNSEFTVVGRIDQKIMFRTYISMWNMFISVTPLCKSFSITMKTNLLKVPLVKRMWSFYKIICR